MTGVFTLNLVDRGLLVLLLQPIKEDLRLTDTQLGFVTGIAFGIFYAVFGLPIGRWADKGNRVRVTALSIGLWGVTVMSSVLVMTYAQLVLARIAAAIGEAGCKPPTYSLVGDYFPKPVERTRAMGIYWLGSPIAGLVSLMAGGWLNAHFGWRVTFLLMGIPGLAMALLVIATIKEPRASDPDWKPHEVIQPPMRAVVTTLWRQPTSRHLSIALILFYTLGYGMAPWYAAFLIRSHGMSTQELGLWLGLIFGLSGGAGIFLGGYVAGRWFADDERGQLRMNALSFASLMPLFLAFLLVPRPWQAIAALAVLQLLFSFFYAPTYALMQRLVPDGMRATALSVVMLFANLIGMGAGPQLVGLSSDLLMPMAGKDSLRYAMLMLSLVALWASYHFWRAGQSVAQDLPAPHAKATPPTG